MKLLQVLPTVPMSRFGENPYAQPIYRVVFSDSRTDLVGGKWPDGRCEYREVPRYPDIHAWILEAWLPAERYAGKREEYERANWDAASGLLTLGPYPQRGEYSHCYTFPCEPGDAMVCQIISAIKRSQFFTPGEQKQAIMEPFAKAEKAQGDRFDAIWGDAMGPWQKADAVVSFASRPFDRAGFKRASDMPVDRWGSAPLPTQDNFFGTILKPETISKLTGEPDARNT